MELSTKTRSESVQSVPIQAGQTMTIALWAKYVPGPSPQHCFKGLPTRVYRAGIIMLGCWTFLISGTNLSMMGSLSSVPGYLEEIGLADSSDTTQLIIGTVNSICYIGVLAGAIFSGWFSDRVGRRRAVVAAGICGVMLIPLLAALQNLAWVLVLRLLNGLVTGLFDSVALNWCAESVEPKHRGLAIGLQLACAASGAGIVYFIIYSLVTTASGDIIWRLPLAFQLIYVLMALSLVYFLPESPRWLVQIGALDEARDVLTLLWPSREYGDDSSRSTSVESRLQMIQLAIEAEFQHKSSSTYWTMFMTKDRLHTARRTWSALLIQFGSQAMIGVSVVTGYGIRILETGGWAADIAALLSGISIFVQAIFGVFGAVLADRIGRRRAMVYGALAGSVLLILIGVCGHFVNITKASGDGRAESFGDAVLALVLAWCAVFGMTWLWCPFLYPAELFPAPSRSRGSSVGIAGFACGAFLINMVSPYLFSAISHNVMFLFSSLSFVLGVMCYFWMPETSRKSLEDIGLLYDKA